MIWLVLFCLPYLLSFGQEQIFKNVVRHNWIPLFIYVILFYLNYLLLVDKFLFSKKTGQFVFINVTVIALFIFLRHQINTQLFDMKIPEGVKTGPPFKLIIYFQTLSSMVPIMFSIAIKTTERWVKAETERKEAVNVQLQSELQFLSYQLQPHFFFNSLNNIYSLVDISPEKAKSTIHSLSKLMRYLLYETNMEKVPLGKEIEFMNKFIELMQLRLPENVKINTNFPDDNLQLMISPLLFVSLIENAFKHGISASEGGEISIIMRTEESQVNFHISNKNYPKTASDKSGSGIGIKNLKQRLELLYPGKYNYTTQIINEQYSVNLEIDTSV